MSLRKQLLESFCEKSKKWDFWLNLVLFASLGFVFWPLTQWIANSAQDQSRFFNALLVLVFAVFILAYFNRISVTQTLALNSPARNSLLLAYLCILITFFLNRLTEPSFLRNITLSSISVTAYCSALCAFVLFIFGVQLRRIAYTACASFGTFIILSTFMSTLDWPLRSLAGEWSAKLLNLLGKSVELGISESAEVAPQLILSVNQIPFVVASECNGFGVILTSLLLALLLTLYQRLRPLSLLINLIAALFTGMAFNAVRIVAIVLLAPHTMTQYDLMHEIVGAASFWTCLCTVWILMGGPTRSALRSDAEA